MLRCARNDKLALRLLLLLPLLSLLASCSHIKRDGPPNFYVDETKIPNAVPKPEPLAKYGNYKSYVVKGKRYYTLRSSRHYSEVGTASWYGTLFHDHKTSSGEMYDMLGMTAAHKTLPLPTYVEVTNLKNHRKIIVKVNDRGPFSSDRLIDLSYVGAKKLGMLGHGTTHVRVTAIDPYSYGRETESSFPSFRSFFRAKQPSADLYLQVGAFRNEDNARRLQTRLSQIVSAPVNIHVPTGDSQLYRVQVGPFTDVAAADQASYQLKSMGLSANKFSGKG